MMLHSMPFGFLFVQDASIFYCMKVHSAEKKKFHPGQIAITTIVLVLLFIVGSGFLAGLPDLSDPQLKRSSETVEVEKIGNDLYFIPKVDKKPLGFIFYPGAKVPEGAYSYLARAVAEAGYPSVLLKMPLGYAIFDTKAAARAVRQLSDVNEWVVSGHSLGGVAAAMFARDNLNIVKGIVFLASYPAGGSSLANTEMRVLSISASNDMLATAEKIEKAKPLLPPHAEYQVIQGGNHAQFGTYGVQKGDGVAEIPAGLQLSAVIESVLAFLAKTM